MTVAFRFAGCRRRDSFSSCRPPSFQFIRLHARFRGTLCLPNGKRSMYTFCYCGRGVGGIAIVPKCRCSRKKDYKSSKSHSNKGVHLGTCVKGISLGLNQTLETKLTWNDMSCDKLSGVRRGVYKGFQTLMLDSIIRTNRCKEQQHGSQMLPHGTRIKPELFMITSDTESAERFLQPHVFL